MKNASFSIIAFVTFTLVGMAQVKNEMRLKPNFESASLIITYENEITEYKFLSLVELNEEASQIVKELIDGRTQDNYLNEITIEIQIEITIGATKGLVCGLIITNCAAATDAIENLKAIVLAAAKMGMFKA